MGNEMQDFEKANLVLEPTEAPTLTLDPDLGETEPTAVSVPEPEKKQEVKAKMPALSPEEQKMVDDFAAKIDITNTNQILQYGAGTQKKMADFSDAALENVKTQDLGEVGDLISSVVGELKDFSAEEEALAKALGWLKANTATRAQTLRTVWAALWQRSRCCIRPKSILDAFRRASNSRRNCSSRAFMRRMY